MLLAYFADPRSDNITFYDTEEDEEFCSNGSITVTSYYEPKCYMTGQGWVRELDDKYLDYVEPPSYWRAPLHKTALRQQLDAERAEAAKRKKKEERLRQKQERQREEEQRMRDAAYQQETAKAWADHLLKEKMQEERTAFEWFLHPFKLTWRYAALTLEDIIERIETPEPLSPGTLRAMLAVNNVRPCIQEIEGSEETLRCYRANEVLFILWKHYIKGKDIFNGTT